MLQLGGGSSYTPELINGFLERVENLPLTELWLMDVLPERLDVVGGFAQRMVAARGAPFAVHLTTDLREAMHETVCRAWCAEGIPADDGYPPLHQYELFQPHLSRLPVPSAFPERVRFHPGQFPETERAATRETVWLNENVFRAGPQGVDDIVTALRKIYEYREALAASQR